MTVAQISNFVGALLPSRCAVATPVPIPMLAHPFLGVDSQTRCYIRNRCVNGDIAPSPIECCANKISDIQRDCGGRNSENCNVYFTTGGGSCTPCFCKQ